MLRWYLISFVLIFCISITGLGLTLNFVSPNEFPFLAQSLLFSLLFGLSFSFFTLTGYFLRRFTHPTINKYIFFNLSFRQGILLAIFTCISAYFLHINAFTWWSELFTLLFLLLIEVFFMTREDAKST